MKTIQMNEKLFWDNVNKTDSCWIWTRPYVKNKSTYFTIKINSKETNKAAHILSWYLSYGELPIDKIIHTCGNKECVKIEHLEICVKKMIVAGAMVGKQCSTCKLLKLFEEFNSDLSHKDKMSSRCKECIEPYSKQYRENHKGENAERNRIWRETNIEYLLEQGRKYREGHKEELREYAINFRAQRAFEIKTLIHEIKNMPCIDCLEYYSSYVMDFDHIDPKTKKGNVSKMAGKTHKIEDIIDEMNKCEIRCANCHRDKTHFEQLRIKNDNDVCEAILRRRKKQDYVNQIKSISCMDCLKQYNYWQMDLDHREPANKLMTICEMIRRNFAMNKIIAEVAKCDPICANCHRERTYIQQQQKMLNSLPLSLLPEV